MHSQKSWKVRLRKLAHRGVDIGLRIPPVIRTLAGLLLIGFGALGFLPILGFWMIPVGGVLVALDIPPLRARLFKKL